MSILAGNLSDGESRQASMTIGAMLFIFGCGFTTFQFYDLFFGGFSGLWGILAGIGGMFISGGFLLFLKGLMEINIAEVILSVEKQP